ncbi:hypothetical protein GCM10023178_06510 [Actinomadura luteofluorescens]
MLFHPSGCLLCCTVRVTNAGGGNPRHPANCSNCGPSWEHRRPDQCVHCHCTAHFRDDTGHPCHKTCAETAMRPTALSGQRDADDAAGTVWGLKGNAA